MGVEWVMTWVGHFSYPAVFLLLLACGLGAPLSEDVIVLVGGTVAAQTHGSLPLMMFTAYLGKLSGDTLIFRFGRRVGPRALSTPRFKKLFTPERIAWIQGHFQKYGVLTVFMARFLPGLRAPTYLVAGVSGFSQKKFLLADMVAAGFSAPILTYLGWRYGMAVLEKLHRTLHGLVGFVVGAVAVFLIARYVRTKLRERAAAKRVPDTMVTDPLDHERSAVESRGASL